MIIDRLKRLLPAAIIVVAVLIYLSRAGGPPPPFVEQRFILDTSVTITIYGLTAKRAEAADDAFSEMERIGKKIDRA